MNEATEVSNGNRTRTFVATSAQAAKGVQVSAPCRLHFGMFSFGNPAVPQFGGVGAMISRPRVTVCVSSAARFEILGDQSDRVRRYVELVAKAWGQAWPPACAITVTSPTDHVGLGVGTQLGLAVAAAVRKFSRLAELPATELSSVIGRGGRSAVGTHGFASGGLIVDAGKTEASAVGALQRRVTLPEEWRFVLVRPAGSQGLAGEREVAAFAALPPVAEEVTRRLWQITNDEMLPAIAVANYTQFGEAVYRFGRLAGECFSVAQGGPFATPAIGALVERIRNHGVAGVGQSSWGPTVFAIVSDTAEAESLCEWLRKDGGAARYEFEIAAPDNVGAVVADAGPT